MYIDVNIEDVLDELTDQDLIDELEQRKGFYFDSKVLLEKIWLNRRENKPFEKELDQLIYKVLGKIV